MESDNVAIFEFRKKALVVEHKTISNVCSLTVSHCSTP